MSVTLIKESDNPSDHISKWTDALHASDWRSNMDIQATILNYHKSGSEELIIEEYSGCTDDLHPRIRENLTVAEADELDAGDWITLIDGEIVETGEFHPSRLVITED